MSAPTPPETYHSPLLNSPFEGTESEYAKASYQALLGVRKAIRTCTACPLHETCVSKRTFLRGNTNPQVLWLGFRPNGYERKGIPYPRDCDAGVWIDKASEYLGLQQQDYAVMKMIKCKPEETEPEVVEAAWGECRYFTLTKIKLLRPAIIICMGRDANQKLLGDLRPLNAFEGTVRPYRYMSKCHVVSTHDPMGFGIPGPATEERMELFKSTIELVGQLLDGWGRLNRPNALMYARGWTPPETDKWKINLPKSRRKKARAKPVNIP